MIVLTDCYSLAPFIESLQPYVIGEIPEKACQALTLGSYTFYTNVVPCEATTHYYEGVISGQDVIFVLTDINSRIAVSKAQDKVDKFWNMLSKRSTSFQILASEELPAEVLEYLPSSAQYIEQQLEYLQIAYNNDPATIPYSRPIFLKYITPKGKHVEALCVKRAEGEYQAINGTKNLSIKAIVEWAPCLPPSYNASFTFHD